MKKIVICDDTYNEQNHLKECLIKYSEEVGLEFCIECFNTGKELIESQIEDVDLFFLDVEMPELNGIETGKIIRQMNHHCEIVFVTNYIQYALQGYEVQAFRYLLKPIEYFQFKDVVNHLIQKLKKSSSFIQVKGRSETQRLYVKDILFAETSQRHILIHTRDKVIDCYNTMEKLEETLVAHGFYRCHSAYLVAMDEISQIQGNDAILKDGTYIPVSKNRKKFFKQTLTDFWGGKFL